MATDILGWESYKFKMVQTLLPGPRILCWPYIYIKSVWRVLHIDGFEQFMVGRIQ